MRPDSHNSPDSYAIEKLTYDALASTGATANSGGRHFVWGHGWGQNRHAMASLAQSLAGLGHHTLLDFPGFGDAPHPGAAWQTADYADLVARLIRTSFDGAPVVWTGHSYGGRVGIQLAARHPELVSHLVLIAAAGLPRQRTLAERARMAGRVYTFKTLKHLAPYVGMDVEKLRSKFGSADYQAAGDMREILIHAIREDLSNQAARISCPTKLIYGARDTETPPEIGERLAALIPSADLTVLDGQDHYSVLGDGRHQVAKRIRDFLTEHNS